MSDPRPDDTPAADAVEPADAVETTGESAWQRRRRLAEVFGDVLPESTRDDRGDGGDGESGTSEEWLRRQVPPHHG